jgi:hypothetical protein
MRIERLLQRDEIAGFEAFDQRPRPAPVEMLPTGGFGRGAAPAEPPAEAEAEVTKKPAAAGLLGKGRGAKRHRRAL